MANKGDSIFNIQIGGADQVAKTVDDVLGYLDTVSKKIEKEKKRKSYLEAIAGDDKEIKASQKRIKALEDAFTSTSKRIRKELSRDQIKGYFQYFPEEKRQITKDLGDIEREFKNTNNELNKLERETTSKTFEAIKDRFGTRSSQDFPGSRSTGTPTEKAVTALDDLSVALNDVGKKSEEAQSDISRYIKTLSEGLTGLDNAFLASREQSETLSTLSSQFGEASNKIMSTVDAGSQLTAMQKAQAGTFSTLSKGLGAAGKAALVAAPAIAAVQVGFSLLNVALGTTQKEIQRNVSLIDAEIENRRRVSKLIEEGNQQRLENQRESIEAQIEQERRRMELLANNAQNMTSAQDQFFTVVSASVNNLISGRSLDDVRGASQVFGEASSEIANSSIKIKQLEDELSLLNQDGIEESIDAFKELNETVKEAEDAIRSVKEAEDTLNDIRLEAVKRQNDYRQDLIDAQNDFDKEMQDLKEKRDRKDKKRLEDHLDNLEDAEEKFNDDTEDMYDDHLKDLTNSQVDYQNDLEEYAKEHREAINKIEKDYREDEREAKIEFEEKEMEEQEEYQKTLAQMEEDFNEERIRRQKDFEDQLFEAELNNDAKRYFEILREQEKANEEAQKEFEEGKAEEKEQFKESKKERQEQFKEERAEAKEQYKKELKDQREAFKEQRQNRKKAYQEQQEQLKKQYREELQLRQEAYRERQDQLREDFKERNDKIEEQRAIEDAERIEALKERRETLTTQFNLEQKYFERREKLLNEYIAGLEDVEKETQVRRDVISDGSIGVEGYKKIRSDIMREINRLEGNVVEGTPDADLLKDLQSLEDIYQSGELESRGLVTLDEESYDAIETAVSRGANVRTSEFAEDNADVLAEAQDPEAFARQRQVDTFNQTGSNADLVGSLPILDYLGLNDSETAGLITQGERSNLRDSEAIIEAYQAGEMSLAELESSVRQTNQNIRETSAQSAQEVERTEDRVRRTREDALLTQEDIAQNAAISTANISQDAYNRREDIAEEGLGNMEGIEQTGVEMRVEAQLEGQEALSESQEDYNESSVEAEEDRADNLLDVQEDANREQQRSEERHQSDLERTTERGQRDIESTVDRGWSDIERDIDSSMRSSARAVRRGMGRIESQFERSLSRLESAVSSMDLSPPDTGPSNASSGGTNPLGTLFDSIFDTSTSSSSDGSSGGSNSSSNLSSSSVFGDDIGSGRGGFTAAAKGIYVDRPTSLIAGEAGGEVILPLDESKGLPRSIQRNIGQEMIRALAEETSSLKRVDTSSDNMSRMMSELRSMSNRERIKVDLGDVTIGGDMSRQEVQDKFDLMFDAIVDVFDKATRSS